MNFKELQQIQSRKKSSDQSRHQQAEKNLQKAFDALSEGLKSKGATRKQWFLRSCDAFGLALSTHRSNPECYIGLAYLHILLNQKTAAFNYIYEAQRLDPGHPDVPTMLAFLKKKPEPQESKTRASQDLESLYDSLTEDMTLAKSQIKTLTPLLKPVIGDALVQQERMFHQWNQKYGHFEEQIQKVDQEFDTHELQTEMFGFTKYIHDLQTCLNISRQMNLVYQGIEQLIHQAQETLKTFSQQERPTLEQALEKMLDQCDALADKLDDFDERGHSIELLEPGYHQMLTVLEILQESLDDF